MISRKTQQEIDILREGGRRLAEIVKQVAARVQSGVTTRELDAYAEERIREYGDTPAFLNYKPDGAPYPFPATLCTSVNEEIVHGIPNDIPLIEGDIISIDCGLIHGGLYTDHAITVPVGSIHPDVHKLIITTQKALERGIEAIQPNGTVGDIGYAIEQFVDDRYGIVRPLAGHGVGYAVHEDPYVPNYGVQGQGAKLHPGMVLAIEPMLNMGGDDVDFLDDGYTVTTKDGSLSAHFEHTVVITPSGAEILTKS